MVDGIQILVGIERKDQAQEIDGEHNDGNDHTKTFIARCVSSFSGTVCVKIAGMIRPITANNSMLDDTSIAFRLNC